MSINSIEVIPPHITPILKLVEFCNFDCSFCRYANNPAPESIMSIDLVKSILKQAADYNVSNGFSSLKVIFHGGEPLLWGLDRFTEIMDFEEHLVESMGLSVFNSIQTNGFLIDEKWIELFKKHRFEVGISIDGPNKLNFHFNSHNAIDSNRRVLENYKKLRQAGIDAGILSVITNEHIGKVEEFYDFLVINNIRNLGLCYCFVPDGSGSVNPDHLGGFLISLFDKYFHGSYTINIREFNSATRKKISGRGSSCTDNCRLSCGSYLTFDSDGLCYFCDDYSKSKLNALGDINEHGIIYLVSLEKYQQLKHESMRILKQKCLGCEAYDICGSGCARNDINFGYENYFCSSYITISKHLNEKVSEVIKMSQK